MFRNNLNLGQRIKNLTVCCTTMASSFPVMSYFMPCVSDCMWGYTTCCIVHEWDDNTNDSHSCETYFNSVWLAEKTGAGGSMQPLLYKMIVSIILVIINIHILNTNQLTTQSSWHYWQQGKHKKSKIMFTCTQHHTIYAKSKF